MKYIKLFNTSEIHAIYIHPDFTGQGIGSEILAKIESVAKERNLYIISLCSTLNAEGFYKHHGYKVSHSAMHLLPNGVKLECIKMSKQLKGNI